MHSKACNCLLSRYAPLQSLMLVGYQHVSWRRSLLSAVIALQLVCIALYLLEFTHREKNIDTLRHSQGPAGLYLLFCFVCVSAHCVHTQWTWVGQQPQPSSESAVIKSQDVYEDFGQKLRKRGREVCRQQGEERGLWRWGSASATADQMFSCSRLPTLLLYSSCQTAGEEGLLRCTRSWSKQCAPCEHLQDSVPLTSCSLQYKIASVSFECETGARDIGKY